MSGRSRLVSDAPSLCVRAVPVDVRGASIRRDRTAGGNFVNVAVLEGGEIRILDFGTSTESDVSLRKRPWQRIDVRRLLVLAGG
jgi:hypothetical protein